jgi:myo-inositol catabolism protein IolC
MTQDEIIDMARQAGISKDHAQGMTIFLEAFAKLVAERERETCAVLCDEENINARHYSAPTQSKWLATKIRAR